jgi:hypothetical protein
MAMGRLGYSMSTKVLWVWEVRFGDSIADGDAVVGVDAVEICLVDY